MAVTISVPHATSPNEDTTAIELKDIMVGIFEIQDIPYNVVEGNTTKHMVDLATSAARNTLYSSELSNYLDISDYHIDIQSFDKDSEPEWILDDVVLGYLETFQEKEALEGLQNSLNDVCNVTIREAKFNNSFSSGMAKMVFGVRTLVIYLNDSVQSVEPIAEKIIDFII